MHDNKSNENDNQVTKEINLDDLYDGSINNTVVIDPVTNDEILFRKKKKNHLFLIILIIIILLLCLYFLYFKTPFGNINRTVKPNVTTTTITKPDQEKGELTCAYNSKSDSQTETATYNAVYVDEKIITSKFEYVVTSNLDTTTDSIEDLKTQYETFYINNSSVISNNISFEKNEKGFSFVNEIDYYKTDINSISVEDGKLILYVKPTTNDSLSSIKKQYENKGYNCNISNEIKG